MLAYNYISGEPVTGLSEGRPIVVRSPQDRFTLANLMRSHLYAAVCGLKIGNDILFNEEKIAVDRITGHGGYFKTPGVGARILAAALSSPISVMETAGEGGAWGIALLACYMVKGGGQPLDQWLDSAIFAGSKGVEIAPSPEEVAGFNAYISSFTRGLDIERAAVACKA